jgi:Tfp pilus assembly protein PilV
MKKTRRLTSNALGISMVELLVAVTVISVVILSLAASSLYSTRTATRSRVHLQATEFQQSEIERLLSLPYDSVISGKRRTPYGTSAWIVTDSFDFKQVISITRYAPGGIAEWDTAVAYRLKP